MRDDAAAGQRRSGLEDPPAADWTGDVWWCGVHSYYVSHAETTTLTTLLDHTGPHWTSADSRHVRAQQPLQVRAGGRA